MRKAIAMAVVLAVLVVVVGIGNPRFFSDINLQNLTRQIGMHGLYALGAGIVIIAGGIDLSLGSWIAFSGIILVQLLMDYQVSIPTAFCIVMGISIFTGTLHGVMVTKIRIQPFVVTLCGLLIYRGLARFITSDEVQGFGIEYQELRMMATGNWLGIPNPAWLTLVSTTLCGIFLHTMKYGRYLYAIGRNPEAVRLSGINVHAYQILTYAIATFFAGFAGILFAFYTNSVQPASAGNAYELYGIAAAVLGGCSLRGGEGTAIGILLGACVIAVLRNSIILLNISSHLELAIIGAVILVGVMADELLRGKEAS